MVLFDETIVAIATPVGRGGIGIVRVSGPDALRVITPFVRLQRPLAAGQTRFCLVVDTATGDVLDEAVVTYFAGPRSYTGEDVVEVAAHGAPVVMDYLLRACCAEGARLADPGEFTQRAFLSGRLDLTQAEAVGDLIEAGTMEQARVAARQLGGALAREVSPAKNALVELIAEMEAGIDFAEDDISLLSGEAIRKRLGAICETLTRLEQSFTYGRLVREGFTLALVGRPNAGKSSLFNCLLERDRAIVTASPGTTRDTITERMSIGGIPVELIDTAGLRVGLNEAEQMGIARSREVVAEAAVVLLVIDVRLPLDAEDLRIIQECKGRTLLAIVNKIDLVDSEGAAERALRELQIATERVSAMTGQGVPELRGKILTALHGGQTGDGTAMVTNLRQHQAITAALRALGTAGKAVDVGVPHEMVLLDLYSGLQGLDTLTGVTTTEDVLRLIFGQFCIGK